MERVWRIAGKLYRMMGSNTSLTEQMLARQTGENKLLTDPFSEEQRGGFRRRFTQASIHSSLSDNAVKTCPIDRTSGLNKNFFLPIPA